MVVIDKATADRLDSGSTEPAVIANALAGKFTNPSNFDTDLKPRMPSLDRRPGFR